MDLRVAVHREDDGVRAHEGERARGRDGEALEDQDVDRVSAGRLGDVRNDQRDLPGARSAGERVGARAVGRVAVGRGDRRRRVARGREVARDVPERRHRARRQLAAEAVGRARSGAARAAQSIVLTLGGHALAARALAVVVAVALLPGRRARPPLRVAATLGAGARHHRRPAVPRVAAGRRLGRRARVGVVCDAAVVARDARVGLGETPVGIADDEGARADAHPKAAPYDPIASAVAPRRMTPGASRSRRSAIDTIVRDSAPLRSDVATPDTVRYSRTCARASEDAALGAPTSSLYPPAAFLHTVASQGWSCRGLPAGR